jgi:CRP-like cAMP-binding protein
MSDIVLDQIPLFSDLGSTRLALLRPLFHRCDCEAGEVIFEQGDIARYLFIVVEGSVSIRYKPDDAPELDVTSIQPGGVFGWSAAFGCGFYTSGAICLTDCNLLRVQGSKLKQLRENHPETGILILERLAAVVAKRLKGTQEHAQVMAFLEHGLKNGVKPIGG